MGYVYIAELNGRYKIGKTADIRARSQNIRTEFPGVKMLHSIATVRHDIVEGMLHQIFQEYCCGGEWFTMPIACLEHLMSITYIGSLDDLRCLGLTSEAIASWHSLHKATHRSKRGPSPKPRYDCVNPLCDRQTTQPPYCTRCRIRVARHGDPSIVKPVGRKRKGDQHA